MIAVISVLTLITARPATAQPQALGEPQQRIIIDKAVELVTANYVFPEKAAAVAQALARHAAAGKYAPLTKLDDFLEALNSDMQAAGTDKHLQVVNNARIVAQLRKEAEGTGGASPEYVAMLRSQNFRLKKVETLEGNIGYFKFDNFVEPEFARDSFVGAMNFLRHTAALVLDLTDNGGGSSEAADLLVSYFLKDGTTIGTWWNRQTNQTTISSVVRSRDVVPMLDTPLFILVSERTASAAEGVAYALQALKRAVVVGAQTRGLANPGVRLPIDDRLFIMVPTIASKNAVTGTNWEGVGVTPDIRIAPDKAAPRATAEALKALAARSADGKEKFRLLFYAAALESVSAPQAPPAGFLDRCVGEDRGRAADRHEGRCPALREGHRRPAPHLHERRHLHGGGSDRLPPEVPGREQRGGPVPGRLVRRHGGHVQAGPLAVNVKEVVH